MNKDELESVLNKQSEKTELYLVALKEDFDHKVNSILEVVNDLPNIKSKVDLTFDKVGEIASDVEVIKETVKDHEVRLQRTKI